MHRHGSPKAQTFATAFMIIAVIVLMAFPVFLVFFREARKTDGDLQAGLEQILQTTEKMHPEEALVIDGVNNTLYLPYDAIDMEGKISISSRSPEMFNAATPEWILLYVVNVMFWQKDGVLMPQVNLSRPAHVCFTLNEGQWADYINRPTEYQVQYYAQDQNPARWEPIPLSVYPERFQICGETTHLSIFGLAMKPDEDGTAPVAGVTVTPNGTWEPTKENIDVTFVFIPKTPTPTPTPLPTSTPLPTATSIPTSTSTNIPTDIPTPTNTEVPTATDAPPTDTDTPPTATDVPTDVPTDIPPTATDVPTDMPTDIPPTATDIPTDIPTDVPTP
ncbi:MAG: hypothetical protein IT311_09210 [Anaerolineales bacterium]|nr:hypothetical protein [Anaerolineales bacterium]